MKKIRGVHKILLQSKKISLCFVNVTAKSLLLFFLKNLRKHFCNLTCKKYTSSNTLKIYRNVYRKNLSVMIYRLPISFQEIEIYCLSVSPKTFLKLSIIVIALVAYKKGYCAHH